MKSLKAGDLTQSELREFCSKIKTPHLRDVFETVILGEERDRDYDVLAAAGKTSFGVKGATRCSNDNDDGKGFVLLFVDGDLSVKGSLTIEDDPPTFLVVTGDLDVEGSLVTAGWVEVQGGAQIKGALAGNYNHGEAHFYGNVSGAILIEDRGYPFSFAGTEAFKTKITDGATAEEIVAKIRAGERWSLPKKTKKAKSLEEHVAGKPDSAFVSYDPGRRFEEGVVLVHKELGRGVVVKVLSTMYVEILFASGKAKFAHRGW